MEGTKNFKSRILKKINFKRPINKYYSPEFTWKKYRSKKIFGIKYQYES
jgi:hypothetical protein